jgi:hypothetical protein
MVRDGTSATKKSLEQLIGRLNHAAHLIPLARFFLGRLRAKLLKTTGPAFRVIKFNHSDKRVIHLWKKFLIKANRGININLLTLRRPTNIIITDACLHGMGGYSLSTGRAWQIDLRRLHLRNNNQLEFLASVIVLLQSHLDNEIPALGNVLVLTDNSSGLCWLHRSSFDPDVKPIHAAIAAKLAETCLSNDFTLHPQHIAGSHNLVADALSRQHDYTRTN